MRPDPTLAAIRFGTGLSPRLAAPCRPGRRCSTELAGPDRMAARWPILPFAERLNNARKFTRLRLARRKGGEGTQAAFTAHRDRIVDLAAADFRHLMMRAAFTGDGLRERLALFWADHFTAAMRGTKYRGAWIGYLEEAIRPNLAGRFADLLRATTTHAVMVTYLDQHLSAGPNSRFGKRHGRGLNENLAREVLELHTLGVGGTYTQDDVRQLAELLTGLTFGPKRGVFFRPAFVEPGAETVLGRRYGGDKPRLEDIYAVLDDLAVHPDTAHHIARKLAVHFVADDPDPALVDHVTAAYRDTGGDLMAVYAALLKHPAAWAPERRKARRPVEFVIAALRALDPLPERVAGLNRRKTRLYLDLPMATMGQALEAPPDPSGWPEEAGAWITPQGLAARLQWALTVPHVLTPDLPDPRRFLTDAVGPEPPAELAFAAKGAATRWEGVGLILASPAFNRR